MQTQLYAIDTAFRHAQGRYAPAVRAAMLRELGYAGCLLALTDEVAWRELPTAIDAIDHADLAVVGLIVRCDVKEGHVDDRLPDAIARLRGRTALLELQLFSTDGYDAPSAPRAVPRAADVIKRVADLARGSGLQLTLSAQRDCWMQRVEDAVRLMMRVNRPDIALTFNACDWYAIDGSELQARLHLALPRLCNVSIGGVLKVGDTHIATPLDAGTLDAFHVLGTLERMGYSGPICLDAGFAGGDVFANLKRSMTAWRDLAGRVSRRAGWSDLGKP